MAVKSFEKGRRFVKGKAVKSSPNRNMSQVQAGMAELVGRLLSVPGHGVSNLEPSYKIISNFSCLFSNIKSGSDMGQFHIFNGTDS